MGWYFGPSEKSALVDELTATSENEVMICRTLKKSLRGNRLWTMEERTAKADGSTLRFIGLYLLSKDRASGTWGYKPMDEMCGPCYHDVPVSYLKACPCPDSEYARNWRAAVAARR